MREGVARGVVGVRAVVLHRVRALPEGARGAEVGQGRVRGGEVDGRELDTLGRVEVWS